MVNLTFLDEIVNATELRNNQKYWLEAASHQPVTIAYGKHKLALLSREKIAELYRQNYYLDMALRLCTGKTDMPELAWVSSLDKDDRAEFTDEFVSAVNKAFSTHNWNEMETLLEDWKATAETMQDKQAMRALKSKIPNDKYIPLR